MNKGWFKKGQIPWVKTVAGTGVLKAWNKGMKFPELTGKNSASWKGDKISYMGIHKWLVITFGKANKCEQCGIIHNKRYHYALLKGKEYQRKRENFWMLCASCHKKYDLTPEVGKKISATKQLRLVMNRINTSS